MDPKTLACEYYHRLDSGAADLLDLFADDVEIYFPKFGVARGKAAFGELIAGLLTSLAAIEHDKDDLVFIVDGNRVAVEGRTRGRLHGGAEWRGGETPGGRFASVFEARDGLIGRMYVYLDPDYGGDHAAGFLWPASDTRGW